MAAAGTGMIEASAALAAKGMSSADASPSTMPMPARISIWIR